MTTFLALLLLVSGVLGACVDRGLWGWAKEARHDKGTHS